METRELLGLAKRTARRMGADPELESIADEALTYALRGWDPSKGPIEPRVVHMVKQAVICHWRKMSIRIKAGPLPTRHRNESVGDDREECIVPEEPPHDTELVVSPYDWTLLWEHHQQRVPLDVMAKLRHTTVSVVKAAIKAAEDRFLIAMLLREE